MKPLIAIVAGILFTGWMIADKVTTSDWRAGAGLTPSQLMTDYMTMTYQEGRGADAAKKYHAANFVEHAPAMPESQNGAPLTHEVKEVLTDGITIGIRHKVGAGRGAPGGEFMDLYRIERGWITAHWRASF